MLQERLWAMDQVEPGWIVANRPLAFALDGLLDVVALESALDGVMRRHETLRTAVVLENGRPVQRIIPFAPMPLPITDIEHDRADASPISLAALMRDEARRPFDLASGRLLRARLIRSSPTRHLLLLTSHHIAADGWSDAVLLAELGALYAAHRSAAPSPLPEPGIQYGDFAAWQRDQADSPEMRADQAYWSGRLTDIPGPVELPADGPRTPGFSFEGGRVATLLPQALLDRLGGIGREEGASLSMVLLAAFAVLLARLGGAEEIVVGMPVAGRTRTMLEPLVGLLSNILPMRVSLAGDPSFRALLRSVRADSLDAYTHQALPLDAMTDASGRGARNAALLFRVLLNVRTIPPPRLQLAGLTVAPLETMSGAVTADVNLDIAPAEGGMRCMLEYNATLFTELRARRFLGHFETLLAGVVATPAASVCALPLLTSAERAGIVTGFNATDVELPFEQCLHELVEAQVRRSPERVSVTDATESLTYAELDRRANILAAMLRSSGAAPNTMVGVCMERSTDMIVAFLATLKTGAACVPLDPTLPPERLALIVADVSAQVIVTDAISASRAPQSAPHLVVDRACWSTTPTPAVSDRVAHPGDAAYVVYTSGSTGRPKGVLNSHRGVCNLLLWARSALRLTEHDSVVQKTPISFDVSVFEIFWPLTTGARLVLPLPDRHVDHAYVAELVRENAVTNIVFVPSHLQRFLEEVPPARCATVRRVICTGEALPPQLVQRFFEQYPEVELYNLYGPTEAAVETSHFRCTPANTDMVPIGRPIANMQMYALDARREPVPVGVTGEVWIGGVGVANGYLDRPELTAERFIPDPFRGAGLLYRTGDHGRYDAAGVLEYLGRSDHQVKLQGTRVELGEIEAVLARHPAVGECVVVACGPTAADRRLAAYVVPARPDAPPTDASLRRHVRASLPELLVPTTFSLLERMPLNPNGKVDRRALPEPDADGAHAQRASYVAPTTPTESIIAGVWAELLSVPRVGRHDDFFALGGDSLAAARAAATLSAMLGVNVPVRAMFERPTVAEFAAVVSRRDTADQVVLVQPGRSGVPPLFILHGDFNGGGVYCRRLAMAIGPDTPVYAVYPHEPGAVETIEAMAADLATPIRAAARGSPCRLVGHCNGGAVAFELARQFAAAGEPVAFIGVIDAGAPHSLIRAAFGVIHAGSYLTADPKSTRRDLSLRACRHILRLAELLPDRRDRTAVRGATVRAAAAIAASIGGGIARRAARVATRVLRGERGRTRESTAARPGTGTQILEERTDWYRKAMQMYLPGALPGPMTLVIPTSRARRPLEDATLNWGRLASSVDVHVVRGSHLSIVGEDITALGEILRRSLREAAGL